MMAQNVNPKEVWVPGANIQDGMAFDYAQHNKLLASTHDFDADVISAATFYRSITTVFLHTFRHFPSYPLRFLMR